MAELIDVTGVEVISQHQLRLTFADGSIGDVDFSGRRWIGIVERLQDPVYFCRVVVTPGLGTIVWPNGADLTPETLYELAVGSLLLSAKANLSRAPHVPIGAERCPVGPSGGKLHFDLADIDHIGLRNRQAIFGEALNVQFDGLPNQALRLLMGGTSDAHAGERRRVGAPARRGALVDDGPGAHGPSLVIPA